MADTTDQVETGNRYSVFAFYGGGLALIFAGLIMVAIGAARQYTAPPKEKVEQTPVPVETNAPQTGWKLTAARDGSWLARSADGKQETALPAFLPKPPLFQPPERTMEAGEIGQIFIQAMERNRYGISRDEYFTLLDLELGGQTVFGDRNRLGELVSGQGVSRKEIKNFEQTQEEVVSKSIEQGKTNIASEPREDESEPSALDAFDPESDLFVRNMRTWKAEILGALTKAKPGRTGYRIEWSYNNKMVTTDISANARSRILSDGWATARRDKLIWLQILTNTGAERLLVDGKFGANSKAALKRHLQATFDPNVANAANQTIVTFLNR